MADIINEGDSKVEVIDSGSAVDAQITAVLNNVERADITSTLISFYNPSDQIETGNATDNNSGAATTFNGLQVNDATIRIQSGDGSSIPQSNLYLDGKSIISDKTLSIGTTGQKELHLGTNSTSRFKITESGYVDFTKMEINGQQGTAGQYIRNTGNGGIEWATLDSNNAFGSISIGGSTIAASSVGDSFSIAAGSNVSLGVSGTTLTINATQPDVFKNIAVSGQSTIAADASTDSLTIAAGTGIQITTDASSDTLTITNTVTAADTVDAVFKTLTVAGQSNVIASTATDTLSLAAGDGIAISTNDSSKEINYRVDALPRLSKEGVLSFNKADGTALQLPLRNFFINQNTSVPVNGGGSQVGQSTRALRMLKSDGSTFKFMVMPANSAGDSLVFTFTKADGNTVTKDITMVA
jgi:voltage-gated potassium channel Kch